MRLWQRRVRLVVAGTGIGCAIAVYAAMRERPAPPEPAPVPTRVDPTALIESSGAVVQQVRGEKQDFLVKAEQQLTYEGGATRLVGVEIAVTNRGGRDYVIRAGEAEAGERQQELRLRGSVRLESTDGFRLETDEAFFSEADGQMRAPGAFSFERRLLQGIGTGMTYDRTSDVLTVIADADIRLTDDGGNTRTRFVAGNAVFTRPQHLIVLGDTVHVLHDEQIADAGRTAVHLSEDDSLLRRVELRVDAEVRGGAAGIETLRAQMIDLDYDEAGQQLTRVRLNERALVTSPGTAGRRAQNIRGGTIDIVLDGSGALESLLARDAVELGLPDSPTEPAKLIQANQLNAEAGPGGTISRASFDGDVLYSEGSGTAEARTVRSRALRVVMADERLSEASFFGSVGFQSRGLDAAGASVAYSPAMGSILITGSDAAGGPRVRDERVSIDAARIDVEIENRNMRAAGAVKTMLQPASSTGSTSGARGRAPSTSRLPGLFEQGRAASGTADSFEYGGDAGRATYRGNATLWQGDTTVRGDVIFLDQGTGDLTVTGAARSSIALAGGVSASRSASLTYADRDRRITYDGGSGGTAQVTGPDGDLRANRVVVRLEATGNRVAGLEARTGVTLKLDTRTATGERLDFLARDERYVMTGSARTPVKIVEGCRETTGGTLTFYKSADRVVIDGNETARTQSVRGQGCSEPAGR